MRAANNGHADAVRVLLEHKADIEAKRNGGQNALMLAAEGPWASADFVRRICALLQGKDLKAVRGMKVQGVQVDYEGEPDAQMADRADTVRALLEAKADVEAKDDRGKTALQWAIAMGD